VSRTRERIRHYVAADPGVHFSELVRALDLAPGQVQYHTSRLVRADALVTEAHRGRTHYFTPAFDEWERTAVATIRRETARDILRVLIEQGATDPDPLARKIGVARSTLEWHLDALIAADLARKEGGEGAGVTITPAQPAATESLLAAVDPSVADRFLDRFERLVDALLAER
jgi:predicted transcriptional regulator